MLKQYLILSALLVPDFLPHVYGIRPTEVRIGSLFPAVLKNGDRVHSHLQARLAFLLAMEHIQDKDDDFYDELLPETELIFFVRDSKNDYGVSTLETVKMVMDSCDSSTTSGTNISGGIAAMIGPGSSSSSIASQNVSMF